MKQIILLVSATALLMNSTVALAMPDTPSQGTQSLNRLSNEEVESGKVASAIRTLTFGAFRAFLTVVFLLDKDCQSDCGFFAARFDNAKALGVDVLRVMAVVGGVKVGQSAVYGKLGLEAMTSDGKKNAVILAILAGATAVAALEVGDWIEDLRSIPEEEQSEILDALDSAIAQDGQLTSERAMNVAKELLGLN